MSESLVSRFKQWPRSTVIRLLKRIPHVDRRLFDLWLDIQTDNLNPETVILAFLNGRFPLTCPESGQIFWASEEVRGIIPIHDFRVPRNLKRLLRQDRFQVSIDTCFDDVVRGCANRDETWITPQIVELYCRLHRMGFAHSFEAWQADELVGGYFGLAIGSYFVGISQFNSVRDAGKVSFLHSLYELQRNGFLMHDVQAFTSHLEQFGCFAMEPSEFQSRQLQAVATPASLDWSAFQLPVPTSEAVLAQNVDAAAHFSTDARQSIMS